MMNALLNKLSPPTLGQPMQFIFSLIRTTTLALICFTNFVFAQESKSNLLDSFEKHIRPTLVKHCYSCHSQSVDKPKGDFRIDTLTTNFNDNTSKDAWPLVLKQIKSGEMPPKTKSKPSETELKLVSEWINSGIKIAKEKRTSEGRTVLRRLNRIEYENTMRDLLGVTVELKELLPPDSSSNGFDNIGEALHTSTFLMDKYLEGAEKGLNLAIANLPQPPLIKKRYSLKDMHPVKNSTEKVFRLQDDGEVICFSSSAWNAVGLTSFYPPDRGKYRFRISSSGFQSSSKPVTFRIDAGVMGMVGKSHLLGYFDASPDKPTVLEFVEELEARGTIRILPYGLSGAQTVNKIGADKYEGAGLAVQWVDVEGPLYESWPPESHRKIFSNLPTKAAPTYNFSKRVEVSSDNPEADAEKIIRDFARRAFRRKVSDQEIQPFLNLVKTKLNEKVSFEQAIRVGLMGILVSKDFLFLNEKPGKLDDFSLASRLSYFLWSTMPDDELLHLAEQNKLSDAKTLKDQVERMLKNPKASAFTENFVGQWLGLREIDSTIPSHILYPEFDEMLKSSMLKETYLFFEEVLKNNLSITNFVASDFSMLNNRLAKHYNIPNVEGWEFRKVNLPKDSHRGGLLTMASVCKVTANGTYTSPIIRGVWVLERILGTPPPRPPEGIAAVEPDIRGATTIREQLAKHRSVSSCATCHIKIDPPGFALESFDVIGGYREFYRTSGNGKPILIEGKRMPYLQGKPIDPSDVFDDKKFSNIDEFKKLLLLNKDQIARALTERLVTYATGATYNSLDQSEIELIVQKIQSKDYGLKTLIQEMVVSDLFRNK